MFSKSTFSSPLTAITELPQGDSAIISDERRTTKQEKEKLNKFKHSSKTNIRNLNSINIIEFIPRKDSKDRFHSENFSS